MLALALLSWPAFAAAQGGWPVDQRDLEFAYATAFDDVVAYGAEHEDPLFDYSLSPRGRARVGSFGALDPSHGSFLAPGQGKVLGKRFAGRDALSLEFFLARLAPKRERAGSILSIRNASAVGGMAIFQGVDSIDVLLATSAQGEHPERVVLCKLPNPEPHHIALSFEAGILTCYVDGEKNGQSDAIRGTFSDWGDGELTIGSGDPKSPGWSGRIEGIALYSRARSAQEVGASARAYRQRVAQRDPVPRLRVELRLSARSRVVTPEELAPYRQSLSVFEYEVLKVHEGEYAEKRIRIAHWCVLDGEVMPFAALPIGEVIRVEVEPFEANRQLESAHMLETLELDPDLPLFFDVGGLSTRFAPQ